MYRKAIVKKQRPKEHNLSLLVAVFSSIISILSIATAFYYNLASLEMQKKLKYTELTFEYKRDFLLKWSDTVATVYPYNNKLETYEEYMDLIHKLEDRLNLLQIVCPKKPYDRIENILTSEENWCLMGIEDHKSSRSYIMSREEKEQLNKYLYELGAIIGSLLIDLFDGKIPATTYESWDDS